MNMTQDFYNKLATHYHKLFLDWESTIQKQAGILSKIFVDRGYDCSARILDCACGIGTQAIGLAALGYQVTASDISQKEIEQAKIRAKENNVQIDFVQANFCTLSQSFSQQFDIVIAMDNALPHMLSSADLEIAVKSIVHQVKNGGLFVASIRDYDSILKDKPSYSPPYIHKTDQGQRVSFQTWEWKGENYKLIQYIIDDEAHLELNKFECEYRATTRDELTRLLLSAGCSEVAWEFPQTTGFYQPIVIATK